MSAHDVSITSLKTTSQDGSWPFDCFYGDVYIIVRDVFRQ